MNKKKYKQHLLWSDFLFFIWFKKKKGSENYAVGRNRIVYCKTYTKCIVRKIKR